MVKLVEGHDPVSHLKKRQTDEIVLFLRIAHFTEVRGHWILRTKVLRDITGQVCKSS